MPEPGPGAPQRGVFVVFEGPEGAGKSTQISRLAERMTAAGRDPLVTREPGGTPLGAVLRQLVLDPARRVSPLTELLLYAADRADHVSEVIEPNLAAGRDVISDRYTGATVAYQGHGRGLDLALIAELNERATGGLKADLTILLDLPPELGLRRVEGRLRPGSSGGGGARRDRLEAEDLAFHLRVRDGFRAMAAADPTWLVVDASTSEESVARSIWQELAARLGAGSGNL